MPVRERDRSEVVTPLLPLARRWSRLLVLGALGAGQLPARRAGTTGLQQAVVLGALALGMPDRKSVV